MDEHEALIEYSEMTSFDFNSREFQEVQKDYRDCKNFASKVMEILGNMVSSAKFLPETK